MKNFRHTRFPVFKSSRQQGRLFAVLSFLACLLLPSVGRAQNDDWIIDDGWIDQSDIDSFKGAVKERYSNFRDSINASFARALAGKWSPFAIKESEKPRKKPEPPAPAVYKDEERPPVRMSYAEPEPSEVSPSESKPVRILPLPDNLLSENYYDISFFNSRMRLRVPDASALAACRLANSSEQAVAALWQQLSDAGFALCIRDLLGQQKRRSLADWSLITMSRDLTLRIWHGDTNLCVIATVYLLNQMEFDARVGRIGDDFIVMVATDGKVYGRQSVTVDGRKYYIIPMSDQNRRYSGRVYSYEATMKGAENPCSLVFAVSPRLNYTPSAKPYTYPIKDTVLSYAVNSNLVEFYKDYPFCDLAVYANSPVDSGFDDFIGRLIQPLIQGLDTRNSVQKMLYFVQFGFAYATDDQQFGCEKYFFCEENFFYPYNDCEDRSILFSYLVRRFTDLDVVLLEYEGHVATAVCFGNETVDGDYFEIDGRRYVVCDPTYEGAPIGKSQPRYSNMSAKLIRLNALKKL